VITSDEAIGLQAVPQRLVVVGAGAIGLELGSVWARLGSQVTVIECAASIVPGMDGDITAAAQRIFAQQGLRFAFETQVKGAVQTAQGLDVQAECKGKPMSFMADTVLVAVGRRPCVQGMGLEDLGVSLDKRGRIVVDAQYQTTVPGLYAIGDLVPGPMLAHKAQEDALACVDALCGRFAKVHYDTLPNVVYTEPEIASVGLTQEQATAQGYQLAVGKAHFAANGRALACGTPEGVVKVLACAKTDRLLGVHIVGQHASELIGLAAVHMAYGGSAEDMARCVLAHPTLGETLREAAWAAGGQALHG
jgi:dihydrolipoamide dehydrogenase